MIDIAQKLGISVVSVSKGLSGKEGVSEKMRQKILETAREMGYESPASVNAVKNTAKMIGVLVEEHFLASKQSYDNNAFYFNLYRELLTNGAEAGFTLVMEIITPAMIREKKLPTVISSQQADALVFLGEISRSYLHLLLQAGLPYVFLDFYDDDYPAYCVLSDNIHGGYIMTRYLLDAGLTKIAFVGSVLATSSIMDRYIGYAKALAQKNLYPRRGWQFEDRGPDGLFIDLQLPKEMPEAFVCSSDEVAYHLTEKLVSAGYRVPEDISVTGYDDYRYAELCSPPLTTYRVNVKGMAEKALVLIKEMLKTGKNDPYSIVVSGEDVVRKSIRGY